MTDKTMHKPPQATRVALDGPAGPTAAARAQGRTMSEKWNEARFFELGFLAERGCLSERTPPRKVA